MEKSLNSMFKTDGAEREYFRQTSSIPILIRHHSNEP